MTENSNSVESLLYIINHVFLPPKLPQKDDSGPDKDYALLAECETALRSFQAYADPEEHWRWASCVDMMTKKLELRNSSGDMLLDKAEKFIGGVRDRAVLAFHIRAQNAGLIVRSLAEQILFESFELSPKTDAVMTTKGRLERCFPGPVITISREILDDVTFCQALAQLFTQLDANTPNEAWPVVKKARSQTIEVRDSIHPKYITEMLTGILHGIGQPFDPIRIRKNTRDDVLWNKALKPWRRSPLWILLRVALQTSLMTEDGGNHQQYKSFMIFFMAHVLERALKASLGSDLLFSMAAKISRRTLKLAVGDETTWMQYVHRTVEAVYRVLDNRWHTIEQNTDPLGYQHEWSASSLSFHEDTRLRLMKLRPYLDGIRIRTAVQSKLDESILKCLPRVEQDHEIFPRFNLSTANSDPLSLVDIEFWVQNSLNHWLTANISSSDACSLLADLIRDYTAAAASSYSESAEETSTMLLTAMDMWVALDKCATHQYPLLIQYEPGFYVSLFDPLLLPKRLQMERLALVEQYIQQRINSSVHATSLIFRDYNKPNSFAVRFFAQSSHHQELRREIEAAAQLQRDQKTVELTTKAAEYARLMHESDMKTCEEFSRWNGFQQETYHVPSWCTKCSLKQRAKNLQITVHEWPLPKDNLEAISVVFELDVPAAIAQWRDTTYSLLVDIFSPSLHMSRADQTYILQDFDGLKRYARTLAGRLNLASVVKPFIVAHYSTQKVSAATKQNICVNNGLQYSLYDSKSGRLTAEVLDRCDIWKICTFQLPSQPYGELQYALDRTTHTSNEALARQVKCPKSWNLHEYYAFVTLRSGHRLQWRNIAREAVTRILNFNNEETYMLVMQSAWQAGTSGAVGSCRESHVDLEENDFGMSLLSALEEALGTFEGNWQGAVAVRIFIALATRLLSISPYSIVHRGCCLFLKRARDITLRWTRDVGQLLHEEKNAEELKTLTLRVVELAMICHSTFDVDEPHLPMVLASNKDVAVITECSIIIHDRCPATTQHFPRSLKPFLQRYKSLSHLLEPILRRHITSDRAGIDSTLRRLWAGYRPGDPWGCLEAPAERWLVTKTSSEGGYSTMTVHYNVLDGSLLINGTPLARLPRPYELHSTYCRLFGEKVLEVVPSTMTDMLFETRNEICGQQVHFRMHNSELIIRTRDQTGAICELIPTHALHGDFPQAIVQEYTQWLDISTGTIEWRPLQSVWKCSQTNWQMQADNHGSFVLSHDSKKMIDIRSPTAVIISRLFAPLENAVHIHVILDCETGALDIHFPRSKLDFFLKIPQSLPESKQFRGMVVDERQSFGAFTGLVNKLVLRDIRGSSRSVIVPHGKVSFSSVDNHVRVIVDTASAASVKYHTYQIDDQLGRLVDNGSLESRLFRLYLHATTSHCLVDQLTGRTGTEEALDGLAGAATKSFVQLRSVEVELLESLAQLTPLHEYYPKHLQVMQNVTWVDLPPLSQHCAFNTHVASILHQAKSVQMFQEQLDLVPIPDLRADTFLLQRTAIRISSFQVYAFGAEAFTREHDACYKSRDHAIDVKRENQTSVTARLVDKWSTNLRTCPRLLSEIESLGKPIHDPEVGHNLNLGFDVMWLDEPAKFMPEHWCSLHDILSMAEVESEKYRIMVFLCTLSYSPYANQELVQTLLAIATVPKLRSLRPPRLSLFELKQGYRPEKQKLVSVIGGHARRFEECPEFKLPNNHGEKKHFADERRMMLFRLAKEKNIKLLTENLVAQWPQAYIETPPNNTYGTYINVEQAMESARTCFDSWQRNSRFKEYVEQAQVILDKLPSEYQHLEEFSFVLPDRSSNARKTHINFDDLTRTPAPNLPAVELGDFDIWIIRHPKGHTGHRKLKELLVHISSNCSSGHEKRYVNDLLKSFDALSKDTLIELKLPPGITELLRVHSLQAQRHLEIVYQTICEHLQDGTCCLVRNSRLLPRISPTSILSLLAHNRIADLPDDWKKSIVLYGLAIAAVQRAKRLLISIGNTTEFMSELENSGHQGWDPMQYPEWLLFEIENNILVRSEQSQISQEMISPSSGLNSVMQLNMGLGKSSVIVPIVAAALADRTQLVRVIVLKPLAMQMFQLLSKKLGGMLNRRICYMPISRSLSLTMHQACEIRELYKECMNTGAILLLQPEHILSFELMGLERLISGDSELGSAMVRTQDWLQLNARDILDESDEILSTRFELIYTMGIQRAIEFSPDRWVLIENVLELVRVITRQVLEQFPYGLEMIPAQPGGFPRIRILEPLAGDEMLKLVAQKLCENGLPGVPVWNLPQTTRAALFRYCTELSIDPLTMQLLKETVADSGSMRCGLLLLRGLFAAGILRFAFEQRRWRVNYGLDLSRTMLAVPYHAKDIPAARAEFSHPDTTIILTCLAYYYGGLSDEQMRACFGVLLQSDHAQEEYTRWVKDAPGLPIAFRQVSGINLSNVGQCFREVFPPLRFARGMINFYLSTIVFPAEMKEFPHKLSSSGWDIAREKAHPTTGFSGTNDSRYILPLSISQCDLPEQLSTNAAVLDCLLRSENSFVDISKISHSKVLDAEILLKAAVELRPAVRVILDVGAQVLELQNHEMAHKWLLQVPHSEAQGVIFFDNRDEVCILTRDGTKEPLHISPFAKQMDQCLVYLDESHTRGTDLKMPTDYRAIVTLGPGLTKDRLVQACMRLRKLGKGQSVVFCCSMEVQRKILEYSENDCKDIEIADVLKWCMAETCAYTRRSIPLWATQGVRHQRRHATYARGKMATTAFTNDLAELLLEAEAQSLETRYGDGGMQPEEEVLLQTVTAEPFIGREKQLNDIRVKCREFDIKSFSTAAVLEEQERELSPENEREQQVELPPALPPWIHHVHEDVRLLIRYGRLKQSSSAFQPAFKSFRNTTAFDSYELKAWPNNLLVTTDFARTIRVVGGQFLDLFLRPVHWMVSLRNRETAVLVILSPFEAQELLPDIRRYKAVTLHLYAPRVSVSVRTLEDLSFCAVPAIHESLPQADIVRHLNLFAGQLYFATFQEYTLVSKFLGLCCYPPDGHIKVACDGFISPASRAILESTTSERCEFMTSPVDFLRKIMALRRKGQSFANSHMGMILNAELITREHF